MSKYLFNCKLCGGQHPAIDYFVDPKTLKRITKKEAQKYSMEDFGKNISFGRYCILQKKYYTKGFIS